MLSQSKWKSTTRIDNQPSEPPFGSSCTRHDHSVQIGYLREYWVWTAYLDTNCCNPRPSRRLGVLCFVGRALREHVQRSFGRCVIDLYCWRPKATNSILAQMAKSERRPHFGIACSAHKGNRGLCTMRFMEQKTAISILACGSSCCFNMWRRASITVDERIAISTQY